VRGVLATVAGSNVTIELTGTTTKQIVAGVFKYQVYETGVQSFIASGNIQYFYCTIKGCNTAQPIALTLASGSVPTGFTGIIPLTIPQPQKTVRVCRCYVAVGGRVQCIVAAAAAAA
jgi:hypothetical protein